MKNLQMLLFVGSPGTNTRLSEHSVAAPVSVQSISMKNLKNIRWNKTDQLNNLLASKVLPLPPPMMERVYLNYEILMCMSKAFIKGEAERKKEARHESKQRRSVTVELSVRLHRSALGCWTNCCCSGCKRVYCPRRNSGGKEFSVSLRIPHAFPLKNHSSSLEVVLLVPPIRSDLRLSRWTFVGRLAQTGHSPHPAGQKMIFNGSLHSV